MPIGIAALLDGNDQRMSRFEISIANTPWADAQSHIAGGQSLESFHIPFSGLGEPG
jgi:hypothetical protein